MRKKSSGPIRDVSEGVSELLEVSQDPYIRAGLFLYGFHHIYLAIRDLGSLIIAKNEDQ